MRDLAIAVLLGVLIVVVVRGCGAFNDYCRDCQIQATSPKGSNRVAQQNNQSVADAVSKDSQGRRKIVSNESVANGKVTVGRAFNWVVGILLIGVLLFNFVGWFNAGAEMVDLPYGVFVLSGAVVVPVFFLLALISWIFGLNDYVGMGMIRELFN